MANMKITIPRYYKRASLLSFASPTCTLSDALAQAAAYLNDNEFQMYRAIKVMDCGKVAEEMPAWISTNNVTGMKMSTPAK